MVHVFHHYSRLIFHLMERLFYVDDFINLPINKKLLTSFSSKERIKLSLSNIERRGFKNERSLIDQ